MFSVTDCSRASSANDSESKVDLREALYNEGATGPASTIQLPRERITHLRGFMLDLDPGLLKPGNSLFPPADEPRKFHDAIRPVLDRHSVLRDAEIRSSGRGLHAIVRFEPAVELRTAADQQRWDTLVRLVQHSVPSDCNAPSITALTRPVGSVNSKTGQTVEVIRHGRPIGPKVVEAFAKQMVSAPFKTVATVLLGQERVASCPCCLSPQSSMGVMDRVGRCYRCGNVSIARLYSVAYQSVDAPAPVGKRNTAKKPRLSGKKHRTA